MEFVSFLAFALVGVCTMCILMVCYHIVVAAALTCLVSACCINKIAILKKCIIISEKSITLIVQEYMVIIFVLMSLS